MMANYNMKVVCRLCGEESSELIRLHIRQPKQRNLKDSIKKYLGIKVTPNDGLPDQVCGPCIAKLDETSDFIEKCVKAQKFFEDFTSGEEPCSSSIEVKDEPLESGESSLLVDNLVDTILQKESSDSTSNTGSFIVSDGHENNSEQLPNEDRSGYYSENNVTIVDKSFIEVMLDEEANGSDDRKKLDDLNTKKVKEKRLKRTIHRCNQCPKSYLKVRSLKTHQRRVHEKSMEKCPKCDKVLSSNYLHQYHILIHSDERPHQCNDCHKTFKTKHEATKHMKTHIPIENRYNYSCEICGKRFTNKGNLTTHIKLHSDERPFVCDQCGKSFRHKGSLEDHQMGHKGEKAFMCNICGKGFFRIQALAVHERCHTGSRPYYCNQCGKGFRSMKVLKRHELIHSDARPYPCQYCGKGFRDHGKRKVHERIHTGERPYECNLCPVAFYESGNLKKHLQKVHKQPRSIHIRLRKDDEANEEKVEYDAAFNNSEAEQETEQHREEQMSSNPLLGHTIFSNSNNMSFMPPPPPPPPPPGPYHIL